MTVVAPRPATGGPGTLVVRADGDARRGLGHVMRCLAVGHEWVRRGGSVTLVTTTTTAGLDHELDALGAEVVTVAAPSGSPADVETTRQVATDRAAAWLVADGPDLSVAYVAGLAPPATATLWIDDLGQADTTGVDLVLNQNHLASPADYPTTDPGRLLTGTDHVLLRPCFTPYADWHRPAPGSGGRVLVFLGGGDPDATTPRVVTALAGLGPGWAVEVVVGAHVDDPHRPDERFTLHRDVADMAGLLAACDLAVIAAGGTLWEALFLQVATLSLTRNPVQEAVIADLARSGAVIDLGPTDALEPARLLTAVATLADDPEARRRLATAGRAVVDGRGAARVVDAMVVRHRV